MRLDGMALKTKIFGGFLLPVVIMAAVSAGCYALSSDVESDARLVKDESAVFAGIARQMKFDVVQVQQWLSDISATRAQDGLDDGFDEAEKSRRSFLKGLASFRQMYSAEQNQASLEELDRLHRAFDGYYQAGRSMAQAYIEGGPAAGNRMMAAFDAAAETLAAEMEPFIEQQTTELDDAMLAIVAGAAKLRKGVFAAALVITFSGLALAWLLTRAIVKPVQEIIDGLDAGSSEVTAAANQISGSSQSLAASSSQQAASIEETSGALEEMSSMTTRNADHAQQADHLMQQANRVIAEAARSMDAMTATMGAISQNGAETRKIIKTIDEIAFQTNLLALNAAVEAARAGEAGAGFAVVADEVRNLALRAGEAARSTSELIDGSVHQIEQGSASVAGTNKAFGEVAASASEVGQLIREISAASKEQSQGVEQINKAITEIDHTVQQNAATSEETASAAEEMNAQAEQMKSIVERLVRLVEGNRVRGRGSRPRARNLPGVAAADARQAWA